MTDNDSDLESVSVVDVVPAPDARRMLVLINIDPAGDSMSASDVEFTMAVLQAHVPRLRAEIARTINRKKTPNLIFEVAKYQPTRPNKG